VSRTLVLQSFHARPWPGVIETCIASTRSWAARHKYAYEFVGDEIIDLLPPLYREKCFGRWPVMTDLARLLLMRDRLDAGADRVVWIDADVLIFAPALFVIDPSLDHAVGREVWVSRDDAGRWRVRRHVHNAVLSFDAGTPALDFLIHATRRVVERLERPASPQIAGPKLLSTLHNLVAFPVLEEAGMLSPAVLADLIAGDGLALLRQIQARRKPMAAANLCHSLLGATVDGVGVDNVLLAESAAILTKDFAARGL
jgi:hypothetical protein